MDYRLIGSSYPSLKDHDRYFLCPFSPNYCGFVRISILIDNEIKTDDEERKIIGKIPYEFVELDIANLKTINKMIIQASDKVLFFSKESDIDYV